MPKKTRTSSFGVPKRESHDSSGFYARNLYGRGLPNLLIGGLPTEENPPIRSESSNSRTRTVPEKPLDDWVDMIYCHTSEDMHHIPDGSVGLAFTSPPYNAGKDFDENLDLREYFGLIGRVAQEVYRVLKPGGRYVINVANLGRKPYIPMHAYFYAIHTAVGFLPAGEVIWQKSKGMNGNCAWGTWRSAKAPRFRDLHEYLLVFSKERFGRPEKGVTQISSEEFMAGTLSIWEIAPESAKRVGHPAPFPVELASRVIRLLSYEGDVVLDPFCGSGTTSVAAVLNGRRYAGYDIVAEYCELARRRISEAKGMP